MASFTEKSRKPFSGWELQPQDLMAFGSRVAKNLQWGGEDGGAVSEVKTRKKVITNVPSKSLLGVRRKKV